MRTKRLFAYYPRLDETCQTLVKAVIEIKFEGPPSLEMASSASINHISNATSVGIYISETIVTYPVRVK